jgi:NADPH2:quinone reductase
VRVAATSINLFDIMRRSGNAKDVAPIKFPGIVGVDLSGTVREVGPGVEGFSVGDQDLRLGKSETPWWSHL